MRKTILIFILVATASVSCQQKSVQDHHDEVMAIHDEVMARMGEIVKLKSTIDDQIEALISAGESGRKLGNLKAGLASLEKADKEMMDWMREYKKPSDDMDQQEAIDYLLVEKGKILHVKTLTDESIELANTLINEENHE